LPSAAVFSVRVNDGGLQRSEVCEITVRFSEPVSYTASAFEVRGITSGVSVGLAVQSQQDGREAVLRFSGPGTDPVSALNGGSPSLADGRYTLTIHGSKVQSSDGTLLNDGRDWKTLPDTPTGAGSHLFRLFGDANGDGTDDATDVGQLKSTFNRNGSDPLYLTFLDADNSGAVDAQDVGQFKARFNANVFSLSAPTYYVNPATGDDANDGTTPSTAWQTWGRLVAAAQSGAIAGGAWVTPDGLPADISTIPTNADKEAWYSAYLQGNRILTGSHIYLDTSKAPLQVTAPLTLPPGCEIASATGSLATLRVNVPIPTSEVWVCPDPVNYPDVWESTGDHYFQSALYEWRGGGWAQLLPVGGDRESSLPQLEMNAGSFWTDSVGHLFTHTIDGGNPNADGVSRQYVPEWAASLGGRFIEVTGGEAYLIGGDGGFGYDPVTMEAQGAAGIGSGEWLDTSIIDSCVWSRAGKHTFSAVGNLGNGFAVFRNDVAQQGPGAVFVGYWSHFVDYTSFSGVGSIMSIYDGCQTVDGWAYVNAPGGTDANPEYAGLIAHSNDGTPAFSERLIENCYFRGALVLGGPETSLAILRDSTVSGALSSYTLTSVVERCKLEYRLPTFMGSDATITDCTIVSGQYYGNPAFIRGNVTFDHCTIDLMQGWVWASSWWRQGPLNLVIRNSTILNSNNEAYGLICHSGPIDTVTLDHDTIEGSPDSWMLRYFNDENLNFTYGDVLNGEAAGHSITNSEFVTDAQAGPSACPDGEFPGRRG
jgi:hypothetical protein